MGMYATIILRQTGLSVTSASYANVIIACVPFPATFLGAIAVDKFGRRPLLFGGTVILMLLNTGMMVFLLIREANPVATWIAYPVVAVASLFMVVFGAGPSIVQWLFTSEIVPHNARSATQAVAMQCSFQGHLFSSLAFFPINQAVGAYCFLIFVIPMGITSVYYYFYLPETKNKTVPEIMKEMGMQTNVHDEKEKKSCDSVSVVDTVGHPRHDSLKT